MTDYNNNQNYRPRNYENSSGNNSNYNRNNTGGWNRNNGNQGGGSWNRNNNGQNYGNKGGYQKNYQRRDEGPLDVQLYKAYVVTGNTDTPDFVIDRMVALVKELEVFGYTLRTGGLKGPDDAVEKVTQKLELYLPWRNFDEKDSKFYFNTPESLEIAKLFHTGWDSLKPAIQAFLAKNARMVLGEKLRSPALFIICWSNDGAETSKEKTSQTGNVGHVIAIASALHIPVFNFGKPDAEQRLRQYLEIPNGSNDRNSDNGGQPDRTSGQHHTGSGNFPTNDGGGHYANDRRQPDRNDGANSSNNYGQQSSRQPDSRGTRPSGDDFGDDFGF